MKRVNLDVVRKPVVEDVVVDNTNSLIPFNYSGDNIRIIKDEKDDPWFIGKDVCNVLGYTNPSKAIQDHCKYAKLFKPNDSLGLEVGPRGVYIINEFDLYRLVIKSQMPKAEDFQDWIVEEVLPTIRKTGGYVSNNSLFINTYFSELSAPGKQILTIILDGKLKAEKELKEAEKELKEAQPKVEFFDAVASSNTAIDIGTAAKLLFNEFNFKIGRNRLFEFLRAQKILMNTNIPYQKFVDKKYFRVIEQKYTLEDGSTNINIKTLVYQEGIQFIYQWLRKCHVKQDK